MKAYKIIGYAFAGFLFVSCAMTHGLHHRMPTASIHLPKGERTETPEVEDVERAVEQLQRISLGPGHDSVYLVEAERDTDGELIMKGGDIGAVYVVAKSKNVAERNGEISIDFIVAIPADLQNRNWGLQLTPMIENNDSIEALQPLSIRGELFSEVQKRQYWQMNRYLNRLLEDTTELSSATALAAKYYRAYNNYMAAEEPHKAERLAYTYRQTVAFPYLSDPRLDSVIIRKGEILYHYTQKYRPTKNTRRLKLFFRGQVSAIDRSVYDFQNTDTLTYSVTSMLSLIDPEPRYMIQVIDKYVEVHDRNYLTFQVGRAEIIDTLGDNRAQLEKIERLMDTLMNQYEFFVNPAPIEVRVQYDRKPLLTTETMAVELSLSKANFTGSYTVVFTHAAGQGFCDGDYAIAEGDAFAVSAEQASFRLAYHPTASGEHRLRFTVSDGRYEQVVEIGCKAYRPESMELPADGVYIHTRNYEGAAFHTLEAWETSEEALSSEVDGIAFLSGDRKVLLPLHALDALPFCGPDDRFDSIPEFLTVSHFDGAQRTRNVHRALLDGAIASAPAVEACYGYEPDYPGRWYLPDIRLLEELAYRFDMEPIRACMQRVGGTLFLTNDTSYLSCSVKCDEVLLTYDYYEFIIAEGRYGKRSALYKDRPCPFFPVRDL